LRSQFADLLHEIHLPCLDDEIQQAGQAHRDQQGAGDSLGEVGEFSDAGDQPENTA
jgi:hypothetical protein